MTIQQSLFSTLPPSPTGRAAANQVIEAGAGTGKTTRIVRDVVLLLLERPDLDPERLVLMTFTEKAAAEIATRVRAGLIGILERLERGERTWPDAHAPLIEIPVQQQAEALVAARRHAERLESIRSQTIHSFCQALLRLHPLEAGVDPSFRIVEGFERSRLLSHAFEEWIDQELMDPQGERAAEWEAALEYAGGLDRLRSAMTSLLSRRSLLAERRYSLGEISELQELLESHMAAIASLEDAVVDGKAIPELTELVRIAREPRPESMTRDELNDFVTSLQRLGSLYATRVPGDAKSAWKAARELVLNDPLRKHTAAAAHRELALRYIAAVDGRKAATGVVDFDDLLDRAALLLDDEAVLRSIRKRFDHIFVDEFQDTDRVQAKIVDALARDDRGALIPGRVTIVGDPKQSIYSFRRAEPEIFHTTVETFTREGAERDVLDTQYRSDPPLVDAINVMFGALFGTGEAIGPVRQPDYHPLHAGRTSVRRELASRVRFLAVETEPGDDAARAEAEAVAEWIWSTRDRHERGPDGDLRRYAILLRKMTNAAAWADVFERRGIDLDLPPTADLFSQRGSADLLAVLGAVADRSDSASLFSAARSLFSGLADHLIAAGMAGERSSEWDRLHHRLGLWREISSDRGVGAVIDAIVDDCGTELVLQLLRGGARWQARIERLRAIAAEFDAHERGTLREFLRELERRRESGGEMDPPAPDEGANAVRLMTVHSAKGLEFDTVILADLASAPQRGSIDAFAVDEASALVMQSPASLNRTTRQLAGCTLAELQKTRGEFERDRLFYVAVTRARCEVVFASTVPGSGSVERKGGSSRETNSEFWVPLSRIFGFEKKELEKELPQSISELVRDVPVGQGTIRVAFERAERPQRPDSPPRLDPGVSLERLSAVEEEPDPRLSRRLDQGEIARSRASQGRRQHGIAVHRALELWEPAIPLPTLARRVGTEHRLDAAATERVAALLEQLESSPTFRLLSSGRVIARELPLAIAGQEGNVQTLRVDLLVRSAEGDLVVIDYKTGRSSRERIEHDAAQVARYCEIVSAISGERCRGLLWYIEEDRSESVC